MAITRVMFVGHGPSNLPADRIVNVFHFLSEGTYPADVEEALDKVQQFYLGARSTRPIAQWLSPWVQRDAELRAYDMESPPDRVPTIRALDLGTVPSSAGLAEEVAMVITLHGAVPPALSSRRRGRIYIGPLNSFCFVGGSTTEKSHPQPTLLADLAEAATELADMSETGMRWSIHSITPSSNYVPIAGGYIDDAFDTQRRRGPDPTTRTLWSA